MTKKHNCIHLNGKAYSLTEAQSLTQVLTELQLLDKKIAVEVNQTICPRSHFDRVQIKAGDKLEIITAVGGG